jgi:hypothetical protein
VAISVLPGAPANLLVGPTVNPVAPKLANAYRAEAYDVQ